MSRKVRWGVLGAASIAVNKVIPAMQLGRHSEIAAIASRDIAKSRGFARQLNIPKSYGSYQDLLDDPEIDAVYVPLPNNLHVEWTERAAASGKHVLCEKPIGLNAKEVAKLIDIRNRTGVKIQEAFMVRTHPSWLAVRDQIRAGRIGSVHSITGFFSYFNQDRSNIRNKNEMGGGALLDIGCYCVNVSRFIFEGEPNRVAGLVERDKATGIDKLTSAMLQFTQGHATFTCSTQLAPYQRMQLIGAKGRIEVQIPFNIPPETPTKIFIDDGSDLYGNSIETIEFGPANQYTIQGDLFSRAILESSGQAVPLEESFKNISVLDAIFRSAETGNWELPQAPR